MEEEDGLFRSFSRVVPNEIEADFRGPGVFEQYGAVHFHQRGETDLAAASVGVQQPRPKVVGAADARVLG